MLDHYLADTNVPCDLLSNTYFVRLEMQLIYIITSALSDSHAHGMYDWPGLVLALILQALAKYHMHNLPFRQ